MRSTPTASRNVPNALIGRAPVVARRAADPRFGFALRPRGRGGAPTRCARAPRAVDGAAIARLVGGWAWRCSHTRRRPAHASPAAHSHRLPPYDPAAPPPPSFTLPPPHARPVSHRPTPARPLRAARHCSALARVGARGSVRTAGGGHGSAARHGLDVKQEQKRAASPCRRARPTESRSRSISRRAPPWSSRARGPAAAARRSARAAPRA